MKISKKTYALLLIANNCNSIFEEKINGPQKPNSNLLNDEYNSTSEKMYVFSWMKVPGTDDKRLKEFLGKKYHIDWVYTAGIAKSEDGKTISISEEDTTLSLTLNDEDSEVILKIDNIETDEFIAKEENGELNIYEKSIKDLLGDAYVNSWSLFGVHDTAILIESGGRLDDAVNKVGDRISKLNEENISIKEQICKRLFSFVQDDLSVDHAEKIKENSQLRELEHIAKLYKKRDNDNKTFKVFEYRVDPLIPLYVAEDIKLNDGIYLIMYMKYDLALLNESLKQNKSMQYNEKNIKNDIVGIFQGFGLFDMIIISRQKDFRDIKNKIIELRQSSLNILPVSETYSLISEPHSLNKLGYKGGLNCSMLLKVKSGAEYYNIWCEIKKKAERIGLNGLCIRKTASLDGDLKCCPPYTSFRLGFFDLAIDLHFKKLEHLREFIDVLDYMPFIEDTSTSISYDAEFDDLGCPGNKS
jgi:hypothetical protein